MEDKMLTRGIKIYKHIVSLEKNKRGRKMWKGKYFIPVKMKQIISTPVMIRNRCFRDLSFIDVPRVFFDT